MRPAVDSELLEYLINCGVHEPDLGLMRHEGKFIYPELFMAFEDADLEFIDERLPRAGHPREALSFHIVFERT